MSVFACDSLSGKTVLITGATGGIGSATARMAAACGAKLVLTGRKADQLESLCRSLPGEGHSFVVSDMCDDQSLSVLAESLPKMDGVVYNAGILQWSLCKGVTESHLQDTLQTNFAGVAMLQSKLMKHKKLAPGASLVFLSSEAAFKPSVGQAVYCASKAALEAYSKALALEVAPRKMRVNCILPAMVQTKMAEAGMMDAEQLDVIAQGYPLKRIGAPEDVAHLVCFLLSDASSWMTGSSLVLDGGAQLV